MSTTQFSARVAVVTYFLLAVGRVGEAEPMLLMEITQRGDDPISQGGASGAFTFNLLFNQSFGEQIGMVGPYTTADVGSTFTMDHPTFAIVEPRLQNAAGRIQIFTGYSGRFMEPVDALWSHPGDFNTTINRFAPRLGVGFAGYDLTAITKTIDQIQWTQSGGNWHGIGQQTVRFYGEAIPEPSTWLLAVFWTCVISHWTRPHQPEFVV
jgi:hypothetical protein